MKLLISTKLKYFILLLALSTGLSFAQGKKKLIINEKPGHLFQTLTINDSVYVIDMDMTELVDIIVEYNDEPMFVQVKKNAFRKVSLYSFQARQIQFSNDLQKIIEGINKAFSTTFEIPKKKREFYKIFNGLSLRVPKAMINEISSLSYVKRVYFDKIVKFGKNVSEKINIANPTFNNFIDQGDSIIIGVIDSGIDYMHPALGGGFGKGYKVVGGYDFVNSDNDPIDDNGHGTHVSGIIAGNSDSLKGVAPNALLMAFKVMNGEGFGRQSNIIAAIEMTLDPNDDNNYDDKLDIVNMSLGSISGDPSDPISISVDNAVSLGVIYCISAGNNGESDNYESIGSPGCAEKAITVGASDLDGKLAYFSSKGPVKNTFTIKPEILAPGVDIKSSVLNGKYAIQSGTSMASPYIAGICALLKHLHKDWSPEMIKSAIVNSAKDLSLNVMAQGAGLVDVKKTMNVKTFAIPSLLNYGLDTLESQTWTKTDTIKIINSSALSQNYKVMANGVVSGISLIPDQNSFTLQSGQSKQLVFTLAVENSVVPYLGKKPLDYWGKVVINGTTDTLNLPWAFIKSPFLVLEFKDICYSYVIYNKDNYFYPYNSFIDDPYLSELLLPPGKYNMFFYFWKTKIGDNLNYYVIRENVEINGYKKMYVSASEADKSITFNGVDHLGRELNSIWDIRGLRLFLSDNITYGFTLTGFNSFWSSAFSENIRLYSDHLRLSSEDEHSIWLINYPVIKGLQGDMQIKNSQEDFIKQNISISLPLDKLDAYWNLEHSFRFGNYAKIANSKGMDKIMEKKWTGTLYLTKEIEKDFGYSIYISANLGQSDLPYFSTGDFREKNNSIFCFDNWDDSFDTFYSWNNGVLNFGDGPIYPSWSFYYGPPISITPSGYLFNKHPFIYGQLKEQRFADLKHSQYTIYDSRNNIIKRDLLLKFTPIEVPKDKYKIELIDSNYTVSGKWGLATLLTDVDEDNLYPRAPEITTLRVLNSSGTPVSQIRTGDNGKVSFSVKSISFDLIDTAETKLFLRKKGTTEWEEIRITKRINDNNLGVMNIADMGKYANYDSSYIDMKIISQNKGKLKTAWTLEPAFAVGKYPYTYADGEKVTSSATPKEYKLFNNYPNPFNPSTRISYALPMRSKVELKIYDVIGRELTTLVNSVQEAGKYDVMFNASGLPSGLYIYKIKAQSLENNRIFEKTAKMMFLK